MWLRRWLPVVVFALLAVGPPIWLNTSQVVIATREIDANSQLDRSMLGLEPRWRPDVGALRSLDEAEGKIVAGTVTTGTMLLASHLLPPPCLAGVDAPAYRPITFATASGCDAYSNEAYYYYALNEVGKDTALRESDVLRTTQPIEAIVELTVGIAAALSGNLQAGDEVDVYATAQQVVASDGRSYTVAVGRDLANPLLAGAVVMAVVPAAESYRVTLGLIDTSNVTIAMEVAPRVDFTLVLRPAPAAGGG